MNKNNTCEDKEEIKRNTYGYKTEIKSNTKIQKMNKNQHIQIKNEINDNTRNARKK